MTLAAAQDGHQGTLGVGQGAAHDLQLLLNQEAGHGGQVVGHAGGGGVGAVDGAEGVGDVDRRPWIGQLPWRRRGRSSSSPFSKRRFSSSMIWPGCRAAALALASAPTTSLGEDDALAQQLARAAWPQGPGSDSGFDLALGLAQVGAGDDGCALLQQVLDGGQGGARCACHR